MLRTFFALLAISMTFATNVHAQELQRESSWTVDQNQMRLTDILGPQNSVDAPSVQVNWSLSLKIFQKDSSAFVVPFLQYGTTMEYGSASWDTFETGAQLKLKSLSFIVAASSSSIIDQTNPRAPKFNDSHGGASYPLGPFSVKAFQDHKAYMIGLERKF